MTVTVSSATGFLNTIYDPIVQRTLQSYRLYSTLIGRKPNPTGGYARWPLLTARNTSAGSYTEASDAISMGNQTRILCSAKIKNLSAGWYVTDKSTAVSSTMASITGATILNDEIREATEAFAQEENSQLLDDGETGGTDGTATNSDNNLDVLGLDLWCDDGNYSNAGSPTITTLAGQTRSSTTALKSQVVDGGSADITAEKMNEALDAKKTYSANYMLDDAVLIASITQTRKILNLLGDNQRFVNTTDLDFGQGFKKVPHFSNIPIYEDPNVNNTDTIYLVDRGTMEYRVLQDATVKELGRTTDQTKGYICKYAEQICKCPAFSVRIHSLA